MSSDPEPYIHIPVVPGQSSTINLISQRHFHSPVFSNVCTQMFSQFTGINLSFFHNKDLLQMLKTPPSRILYHSGRFLLMPLGRDVSLMWYLFLVNKTKYPPIRSATCIVTFQICIIYIPYERVFFKGGNLTFFQDVKITSRICNGSKYRLGRV